MTYQNLDIFQYTWDILTVFASIQNQKVNFRFFSITKSNNSFLFWKLFSNRGREESLQSILVVVLEISMITKSRDVLRIIMPIITQHIFYQI